MIQSNERPLLFQAWPPPPHGATLAPTHRIPQSWQYASSLATRKTSHPPSYCPISYDQKGGQDTNRHEQTVQQTFYREICEGCLSGLRNVSFHSVSYTSQGPMLGTSVISLFFCRGFTCSHTSTTNGVGNDPVKEEAHAFPCMTPPHVATPALTHRIPQSWKYASSLATRKTSHPPPHCPISYDQKSAQDTDRPKQSIQWTFYREYVRAASNDWPEQTIQHLLKQHMPGLPHWLANTSFHSVFYRFPKAGTGHLPTRWFIFCWGFKLHHLLHIPHQCLLFNRLF